MKVFVQIPCLNEAETLPLVLESIPKKINGVDDLEILVIDDGSTDGTLDVAKAHGVKHFVRHAQRMGLARSFNDGVNYSLAHGADIVVNTDGDNQYPQARIDDLVQPIIAGQSDIVVADRQTHQVAEFSWLKKRLQKLGSLIVNKVAGTNIPDAASGFRAYSRLALIRLNVTTTFSYCMETIIQAGNKQLSITSIPIVTNPKTRESRLFKNMWQHIWHSGAAILRAYIMYRPFLLFVNTGGLLTVIGLVPFVRYLYFYVQHQHGNHLQSLLVGSILLFGAFLCFALAVIADLIRVNRVLQEQELEHLKQIRFQN